MIENEPIHVLLDKVSRDVGAVRKDGHNKNQNFHFRGIDAVVNATHSALREYGVVVVPKVLSADYEKITTSGGKASVSVRLMVEHEWRGPGGDVLVSRVAAEANDTADKATSKAMSVALRTALLQVLHLPTDDPDPDLSHNEIEMQQPEHVALMGRLVALCKSKEIPRAEGQAQFEALGGSGELADCTDVGLLSELIDTFKGA